MRLNPPGHSGNAVEGSLGKGAQNAAANCLVRPEEVSMKSQVVVSSKRGVLSPSYALLLGGLFPRLLNS